MGRSWFGYAADGGWRPKLNMTFFGRTRSMVGLTEFGMPNSELWKERLKIARCMYEIGRCVSERG